MGRFGTRETKDRSSSLFLFFPWFCISFLTLFWICLGSNYITPLSSPLAKMYLWLIMHAENKLNIWITLPVIGEIALCFHILTTKKASTNDQGVGVGGIIHCNWPYYHRERTQTQLWAISVSKKSNVIKIIWKLTKKKKNLLELWLHNDW